MSSLVRFVRATVRSASLTCNVPTGWIEPGQNCPEFEEFTLVLKGILRVAHRDGVLDVHAGQAIITHSGEWSYQYGTPETDGAGIRRFVCLPAFFDGNRTSGLMTEAVLVDFIFTTCGIRPPTAGPCKH